MITSALVAAVMILAVAVAVSVYIIDRVRRKEALFRWASDNGYQVLRFSQPMVETTPFPSRQASRSMFSRLLLPIPQDVKETHL